MEIKDLRIYETQNTDLATFLMLEGVKLLECRKSEKSKNVIVMRFLDDRQNCLDLEHAYLNSNYKKFRDINKYLLMKVKETLRSE